MVLCREGISDVQTEHCHTCALTMQSVVDGSVMTGLQTAIGGVAVTTTRAVQVAVVPMQFVALS